MPQPADPEFTRWLARFQEAEALPDGFAELVASLHERLATWIDRRARGHAGLSVVGLCGPQGSGKSTMVPVLARLLGAAGWRVAVLSLDDLYCTRDERQKLARDVHPLLATRGPPGTHDVHAACEVIAALAEGRETALPRFDKALDDRRPRSEWPLVASVQILLFEGWCVGAAPEPEPCLDEPINALEREEDPAGAWRHYVNAMLAGPYRQLFGQLDLLIQLRAPSFEAVESWRLEQEAKLRAATTAPASRVMTPAQVLRFVQHFERTTRQINREMPSRADCVIALGAHREVLNWSAHAPE